MTFFAAVTEQDLAREHQVEQIVAENIEQWQQQGLVPDMAIEPGDKTDEPIRTRGWTYWHHLFNARQLHFFSLFNEYSSNVDHLYASSYLRLKFATLTDYAGRLSRWSVANAHSQGGGREVPTNVFSNQALNTLYNYGLTLMVASLILFIQRN